MTVPLDCCLSGTTSKRGWSGRSFFGCCFVDVLAVAVTAVAVADEDDGARDIDDTTVAAIAVADAGGGGGVEARTIVVVLGYSKRSLNQRLAIISQNDDAKNIFFYDDTS